MIDKPSSKKSNPLRLRLLGQAAVKAGTDNDEPRMKAAGERWYEFPEFGGYLENVGSH